MCCLLIGFGAAAAAAPCDAPPGNSRELECRREVADLQRRMESLLKDYTDLHPAVRSVRRAIEEKGDCANPPASLDAGAMPVETTTTITVDLASELQALHGFGATYPLSMFDGDHLTADQQRRIVGLLVSGIGALAGEAQPAIEATRPAAPATGTGFSRPLDFSATEKLFRMFAPGSVGDIYPFASINVRWQHPWLRELRAADFDRYLDEVAGKALATVADWKQRSGREPEFLQLWNEPLSGNGELGGGSLRELVETIKRVGRRLREAGYSRVRFVVPNEETVASTLEAMRAIGADGEALGYVGAIGYHVYPYGSEYAYVPRLLATRAQGRDFEGPVRERDVLRSLSLQYGLPVWMTEVASGYGRRGPGSASGDAVADSIDWIVGRAIHMHDEFRYAGASAFYGMYAVWTDAADRDHSPGAGARNLRTESGDHLVLVDTGSNEVFLGAIGHAIGHYGRWLRKGARYLQGQASSPFVLVSPFRDRGRLVAVLVNTAKSGIRATIRLRGGEFSGPVAGDQTRTGSCRQPIASVEADGPSLDLDLPAWSVTTLSAPIR